MEVEFILIFSLLRELKCCVNLWKIFWIYMLESEEYVCV